MKKRLISSILSIALIAATPAVVFGQTSQAAPSETALSSSTYQSGIITPQFAGISTALVSISFSGSKATATVYVTPKSSTSIDYMTVKASVMKSGSSTAVKSWSQTIQPTSNNTFYFSESTSVSSRGTYYVKATIKCYKNGSVIDTLNAESDTATY